MIKRERVDAVRCGQKGRRTNAFPATYTCLKSHGSERRSKTSTDVRRPAAIVGLALFLASCSSISTLDDHPNPARSQQEAGSVHIAVLSAGLWDNYRDKLQPKFDITAQQALDGAISPTKTIQDSVLDAYRFALSAQHAPVASTANSTGTDAAGSASTTATQSSSSTATAPSAPTDIVLPSELRAPAFVDAGTPVLDASLKYAAAAALYEEVQLLDRYIDDLSRREDYVAYVVRLQVSVMPNGRNRPYDTYANVSFLWQDPYGPQPDATDSSTAAFIDELNAASEFSQSASEFVFPEKHAADEAKTEDAQKATKAIQSLTDASAKLQAKLKAAALPRGLEIVPILVTDDLETTAHSSVADQLRELDFALSVLAPTVGVGANLQRVTETMRKLVGADMNSLLTVARLTDNTVRVRFGAQQAVDTAYAMVPRTHNVSLALLVPRERAHESNALLRQVEAVLRTEFRDVKNGEPLPVDTLDTTADAIRRQLPILCHVQGNDQILVKQLQNWSERYVLTNKQQAFRKDFYSGNFSQMCPLATEEAVWAELTALQVGSSHAATHFELPFYEMIQSPDWMYVSPLIDDGKAPKMKIWSDHRFPSKSKDVDYALCVDTHCGDAPTCDYVLPGSEDAVSGSSYRQIELTFPPLPTISRPFSLQASAKPALPPLYCPGSAKKDAKTAKMPTCDASHTEEACSYTAQSWRYYVIARWDDLAHDNDAGVPDWKMREPFLPLDYRDRFNNDVTCGKPTSGKCAVASVTYVPGATRAEPKATFDASTTIQRLEMESGRKGTVRVLVDIKDPATKVSVGAKDAEVAKLEGSSAGCVDANGKGWRWEVTKSCVVTVFLEGLSEHFQIVLATAGAKDAPADGSGDSKPATTKVLDLEARPASKEGTVFVPFSH